MGQCTKRTNETNMFGAKRTIKYYSIQMQINDLKWNKAIVDDQIDDNNREEEVDDEYEYVEEDSSSILVGSHIAEDQVYDDYDFSIGSISESNFNHHNVIKNKMMNFGIGIGKKNGLYLDEIASSTHDCSQTEIATPTLSKVPLLESPEEDPDDPLV